ncbi:MAG: dienelactone hydrolase family protein [Hyphomicrobiales bacterium]|nr:dienelactone hydrolase family protein [Hyphomicrobiales bacterium]MBV9138524.1 dienelactone hydrolase family protein [Hyphomicrobiales bacterium]MBV9591452.1 dienelactone hydrolase family protein [Hyphomicrobiales bacterium]MBV9975025.1 dienelactone hydrolase family protein [Hyphomicrobiales bacterium]
MTSPALDGPRLMPRSGAPAQLIVLLHGYGADGKDLIELGRQWQRLLPQAAFVAPNAPERLPMSPVGRQWFALTLREPAERWKGVTQARPALDAFLDAELRRHALGPSALALVGFSQGTMMALHCGLRREAAPAAIVGFSGLLVLEPGKGRESLKAEARSKPPILLIHGEADDLIPATALFDSAESLAESGIPCEWHLSPRLGHGIDAEGLRQGGEFIVAAYARARQAARR